MSNKKFIERLEDEILILGKRIRDFRKIGYEHWIARYKIHKQNAKDLLILARSLENNS